MLESIELKPRIGSEIKIDKGTLLDGSHAREIRALLDQRGVLIMRDIGFTDEEQRVFSTTLGDVRLDTGRERYDENERLGGLLRVEYFTGTFFWHMDGTYEAVPPLASILTPRILSQTGGQTEFANTYVALEDLAKDEQDYLTTLRVVHTMQASMFDAEPNATPEQFEAWFKFPKRTHPLVWQHQSGRKSLVIGSSGSYIVGMHVAESRALLDRLVAHATSDPYVYRHEWRMGDVVMWDNTGTMHRAGPYAKESGRKLHRFQVEGEEPITAAA